MNGICITTKTFRRRLSSKRNENVQDEIEVMCSLEEGIEVKENKKVTIMLRRVDKKPVQRVPNCHNCPRG